MELVIKTYDKWNIRISTGYLNRWLGAFKKVQSLPSGGGERLSIKYMAQIKSRPPTFYVFVNNKELMKINYLKNFRNALAKEFGIEGIPIRILLRDKANKKEKERKQKPGFIIKGKESKPMGRSAIFTKPTPQKKPQSRKSSPRSKVK
jgi:GTP-binding protein